MERKERGEERIADRKERDIRGGGVLTEFELTRQQNSCPVRFVLYPLLMWVCEYVCLWSGASVSAEKSEVIDGLQKNADGWFISASHGNLRGNMSDL